MLSPKSKWLLVPLFSVAGLWIWPMAAPAQNQPASDKPAPGIIINAERRLRR